jgi:hypothetical protein
MSQTKLLLDTNAYLRLAYTIHPLLFVSFGDENYTLYVTENFQAEFNRQPRFKKKFAWVNESKFMLNREKFLTLSNQEKKDIKLAETYIWDQNISLAAGASMVDVRALAAGYVLDIPVITDDKGMISLAESLGIKVMRILPLLSIMLKARHIDKSKIKELVGWLSYSKDLPYKNFIADVNAEFGFDLY